LTSYSIYYDNASGSTYQELVSGLTATSYTATGLTQGSTYQFKVKGKNSLGLSWSSNTVSIQAAAIPDVPLAPVTEFIPASDSITITWIEPNSGGSPITSYHVLIKQGDDAFSE
jgi:cellulose 1,4-beta-cellobiosidase